MQSHLGYPVVFGARWWGKPKGADAVDAGSVSTDPKRARITPVMKEDRFTPFVRAARNAPDVTTLNHNYLRAEGLTSTVVERSQNRARTGAIIAASIFAPITAVLADGSQNLMQFYQALFVNTPFEAWYGPLGQMISGTLSGITSGAPVAAGFLRNGRIARQRLGDVREETVDRFHMVKQPGDQLVVGMPAKPRKKYWLAGPQVNTPEILRADGVGSLPNRSAELAPAQVMDGLGDPAVLADEPFQGAGVRIQDRPAADSVDSVAQAPVVSKPLLVRLKGLVPGQLPDWMTAWRKTKS